MMPLSALTQAPNALSIAQLLQHHVPAGPELGQSHPRLMSLRHLLELKLKLIPLVRFLVLKLHF